MLQKASIFWRGGKLYQSKRCTYMTSNIREYTGSDADSDKKQMNKESYSSIAKRRWSQIISSVSFPVQPILKSNSCMYSMPMFLTFFFLMIFPSPGDERTGSNACLNQDTGVSDTGKPYEPNSVSEIIMVMDWLFTFQNLKLDSIWLWENQLY